MNKLLLVALLLCVASADLLLMSNDQSNIATDDVSGSENIPMPAIMPKLIPEPEQISNQGETPIPAILPMIDPIMPSTTQASSGFLPLDPSNIPTTPEISKKEAKEMRIRQKHAELVQEANKHHQEKISEIMTISDNEEIAKKIERANKKHQKHLNHLDEKMNEKLQQLEEEGADSDDEDEEGEQFSGLKLTKEQKKKLKNSWTGKNKQFKKLGKQLFVFFIISLILALIIRKIKQRRERRRRMRQQLEQQLPQQTYQPQPQQQQQHRPQMMQQNYTPSSVPQYYNPTSVPKYVPASNEKYVPLTNNHSVPHSNEKYVPLSVPQYVPFAPNSQPKKLRANHHEKIQPQFNDSKRENEIEMKRIPSPESSKESEDISQEKTVHSNENGQVHYLPVRILPNGQMVLLSAPPQGVNLPREGRADKYPNLDNVIVGAPVYNNNYNYPMKSQ